MTMFWHSVLEALRVVLYGKMPLWGLTKERDIEIVLFFLCLSILASKECVMEAFTCMELQAQIRPLFV